MAAIAWGSVFYGHSVYLTALTGDGRWSIGQISTGITIFWVSSLPGTLFVGYLILLTYVIANFSEISDKYNAVICDLWGCLHNGIESFPEALKSLE